MARTSLPPGFRFHPTDVELIMYYLLRKVTGKKLHLEAISELNIYQFSPWDLPDKSCLKAKDLEWYFFCPRERKYSSGARMNRATETGYWKATGRDRAISYNNRVVGMAKTLVFHEGNAPQGKRTDWVLHEYRLEDRKLADAGVVQDSFVLCKVFKKCGLGPKNGAQYGAPFKEEEWDADDFDTSVLPSDVLLPLVNALPEAQNCSVATNMAAPGSGCRPLLIEPAESKIQSSSNTGLPSAQNYSLAINVVDPGSSSGWSLTDVAPGNVSLYVNDHSTDEAEDIARLLSAFSEEDAVLENCNFQLGDLIGGGNNAGSVSFNGSQDVCNLGCRVDAPASQYWLNQNNLLRPNDMTFLELDDLGASHAFSGLYEAFTPFGAQQSVFPGLANPNSNCNQSLYNGPFFGHQTNIPVLSETPMLSNSSDGLLDSLISPQTAKSCTKNLPQGGSSTIHFDPTSDSQPGNVRGAGGIQD